MTADGEKKLKILLVSTVFPYQLDRGDSLIVYHLLRQLSKACRIELLTLHDDDMQLSRIDALKQICNSLQVFPVARKGSRIKRLLNFASGSPWEVALKYSPELAEAISARLKQRQYDLVHLQPRSAAPYFDLTKSLPTVLFAQDSMTLKIERWIDTRKGLLRTLLASRELSKAKRFESGYKKFDKCIVVSEVDGRRLLELDPQIDVTAVPNGVDTDYFSPIEGREEFPSIVFTGNMGYAPNVDAAVYFCDEVLPLIEREHGSVKLYLAGSSPTPELRQLGREKQNVIITGYVDDLREYFARGTIYVSPLRVGAGIKNKVLEAMAMARAIVATSISCDGIGVTNGTHLYIEDDSKAFAQRIIELFADEKKRKDMGDAARDYVIRNHSWETVGCNVLQIWKEAMNKHRSNGMENQDR